MYLYKLIIISLFCYGEAICQPDYDLYLQKNNQVSIKNNYEFDSIILKGGGKIKFSKNDTTAFVNLITKDTIYPIIESDINSGLKRLGGLCADFDNSFFWGISMGNGIYGRVYYKVNKISSSNVYIFICKYKVRDTNVILLADPNYTNNLETFYLYGNNYCNFSEYSSCKPIPPLNLKYLRILLLKGKSIQLKDVKNNKLYSLTLKKMPPLRGL